MNTYMHFTVMLLETPSTLAFTRLSILCHTSPPDTPSPVRVTYSKCHSSRHCVHVATTLDRCLLALQPLRSPDQRSQPLIQRRQVPIQYSTTGGMHTSARISSASRMLWHHAAKSAVMASAEAVKNRATRENMSSMVRAALRARGQNS